MATFFKDFIAECKRVVWPNKQELTNLTLNVLGFSIIVGIIIYIMDFVVNSGVIKLADFIMGKLV